MVPASCTADSNCICSASCLESKPSNVRMQRDVTTACLAEWFRGQVQQADGLEERCLGLGCASGRDSLG